MSEAGDSTRTDGKDPKPSVEQLEQKLTRDVYVFELGVQRLYARDVSDSPGVELYKRAGTTDDIEEMVAHDGPLILEGSFRRVEEDEYGCPTAYHPYAGRMERLGGERPERTDVNAVLLTEVDRLV